MLQNKNNSLCIGGGVKYMQGVLVDEQNNLFYRQKDQLGEQNILIDEKIDVHFQQICLKYLQMWVILPNTPHKCVYN